MLRPWAILLCLPLAARPLSAQDDPAILQIRIIEGESAVYAIGGRATRGVTVQVTDETGKPVNGATVSFTLPEEGPSGSFSSGSRTEIATTHADGRAAAWGMQWNRTAGQFEIRITALKGQARAGTVVAQFLSDASGARESSSRPRYAGSGHKWLWISLAAAGAVAGGAAGMALNGKSSAAPLSGVVRIGAPTIILGHP